MIRNANSKPQVYYGLHMLPGVAEYIGESGSYRIFINESTIKKMDPTFVGLPVYVDHKEEVNMDKIQAEADGYVVKSFYNEADGKHWAEFIIVSDKGHEAIRNGWKLSNAYIPKNFGQGGLWNGVEYQKEVTDGEYEHLALVQNPRYGESVILTPEAFKQYNADKKQELHRLANSKGEKSVLKLFKKQKVENSADFDNTMVELPNSKREVTLKEAVEIADKFVNMAGYASGDHMVKAGDEEMSVNDMIKGYEDMKNTMAADEEKKKNEADDEEKKKENEDDEEKKKENEDDDDKKENSEIPASYDPEDSNASMNEGDEDKKKENDDDEVEKKKKNSHYNALKNAPMGAINDRISLDFDKVERGKSRYGSGK